MADAASTLPQNDQKPNGDKSERIPRGSAPPALKLADAVALAKKIYEQAAGTATYDMFSQLTGNSRTSSSFLRKLAALRQYGIIEDTDNIAKLSEIGTRIVAPQDAGDDLAAIKEAMLRLDYLNKIFERHKGRILPDDEFLKNFIIQEVRVPREVAGLWMNLFKEDALTAKLLYVRPDGKTQVLEGPKSAPKSGGDAGAASVKKDDILPPPNPSATAAPNIERNPDLILIQLGQRRVATLELPSDWDSKKDLKRLLMMLKLSLSDDIPEDIK